MIAVAHAAWRPEHEPATLTDVADGIAGPGEHAAEDAPPQPSFRAFNVVAVFERCTSAERALEAGRAAYGVPAVSFVALHRDGQDCPDSLDDDEPGLTTRLAARGAALGAAAGAALGAAGVAMVPGLGAVIGFGLLSAAIGGAGLGGATGGVVGAYANRREADVFGGASGIDLTHARAVVGIHVDDADVAASARRLLDEYEPEATCVFGADGRAVGR